MGNERLARGEGGLGETERVTLVADRDTWVETGTAVAGPVLLVGRTGTYEARAFFKVARWNLPNTDDPTFSLISVGLVAPTDLPGTSSLVPPVTIQLGRIDTVWNYQTVTWDSLPRVAPEILAESTLTARENPLVINFTAYAPLDSLKKWHLDPSSMQGFRLSFSSASGEGLEAYHSDSLRIRVAFRITVNGTVRDSTLDSRTVEQVYVHTPASLVPTGVETPLPLGTPEGYGIALHFPTQPIPEGSSIHEVSLLLPVDPSTDSGPFTNEGRSVNLEVRTAGADWSEGVTSSAALSPSASIAGAALLAAYHGEADSVLTVKLRLGLAREWSTSPASNLGLLVTSVRGELAPLWISSRESGRAPRLRIAYTPPPGTRF